MTSQRCLARTPTFWLEKLDRRIIARRADVRDPTAMESVLAEGVAELGRLDIVVANAGILSSGPASELSTASWQDMIDVNLSGVYYSVRAAIPHLIAGGNGGSIILTSSSLGIRAMPNVAHYVAAKAGVIGLMRSLALELGPHSIRVNTLNPSIVDTDMIQNPSTYGLFIPHIPHPTREQAAEVFATLNVLPTPWAQAEDISNAVAFLASDESRFVTGQEFKIDSGFTLG